MVQQSLRVAPYIVYIAGIHVPVVQVTVISSVWDIPRAEISMTPDHALEDFGEADNVPVQIFVYDWDAPEGLRGWRFLMSGIIATQSYSSVSGQRSTTFLVMDDLWLLDRAPLYATSSLSNTITSFVDPSPGVQGQYLAEPLMPAALFYRGINPVGDTLISRPHDLLVNALDYLVGTTVLPGYDPAKADPGVPAALGCRSASSVYWLAPRMRMTGLVDCFLPCPVIEDTDAAAPFPALQAVQTDMVLRVVRRATSGISEGDSLWKILSQLYRIFFYEIAPVLAPAAVEYQYTPGSISGPMRRGAYGRLARYITKPRTPFGAVPWCNVVWPSQAQSVQRQDDWQSSPTRLLLSDSWLFTQVQTTEGSAVKDLAAYADATGWPPRFQQVLDEHLGRAGYEQKLHVSPHSTLVSLDELYRGPVTSRQDLPTPLAALVSALEEEYNQAYNIPTLQEDPRAYLLELQAFDQRIDTAIQTLDKLREDAQRRLEQLAAVANDSDGTVAELDQEIEDLGRMTNELRGVQSLVRTYGRRVESAIAISAEDPASAAKNLPLTASDESLTQLRQAIAQRRSTLQDAGRLANIELEPPVDPANNRSTYAPEADVLVQTRLAYAAHQWATDHFQHHGGATGMPFNPYVVAGLPGIIFDRDGTGQPSLVDIVGVTHTLTQNEARTTVSYTFERTLTRLYRLGKTLPGPLVQCELPVWPADPLVRVREVFQTDSGANSYYRKALFANTTAQEATGYHANPDALFVADLDGVESRGSELTLTQLETGRVRWRVADGFKDKATDMEAAFERSWRPGTSIAQWRQLIAQQTNESIPNYDDEEMETSDIEPFPVELWRYSVRSPTPVFDRTHEDALRVTELAQLRVDWPARMREYRERVLAHKHTGPRQT